MSTVARDVGIGPGDLKILVGLGVLILPAAPFYTGLRLKRSGIGTRFLDNGDGTTQTDEISYSREITFGRAEYSAEDFFGVSPMFYNGGIPASISGDAAVLLLSPGAGEVYLHVEWRAHQFAAARQIVVAHLGSQSLSEASIGTRTFVDTNPTPDVVTTEDIRDTIELLQPGFFKTGTPADPRYEVDRWGFDDGSGGSTMAIDISGWTASQWRDLRGVHSAYYDEPLDSWTSNDVRHTYEWELV